MGSLSQEAEVVVIGGGPGGYVAAIRAADLGKEVLVVEQREKLGGVCLLEGCIPSKALIHAVETIEAARAAKKMGITFGEAQIDAAALRKWTGSVVDGLSGGVAQLFKNRGIEVVKGRARFEGPGRLALEGSDVASVSYRHCIIATGSRPSRLPLGGDLPVWSSTEAVALPEIPQKLLVVGGGYIGLELGLVYAGLGSRVSVVELLPNLLTGADQDLVNVVHKSAARRLDEILLESKVVGLQKSEAGVAVSIEHAGQTAVREYTHVLVAVGRRPNTDELGLDRLGVQPGKSGLLEVGPDLRVGPENVFAIGDVTPGPMLAHRASRQGKVAAEIIAGRPALFDNVAVPAVVFTDPEIAWAGLTEAEAKERGVAFTIGRFPLSALGRARTMGRTEGLAKVLADPQSGLVLGVGLVGPHASDLIAEAVLALEMGATIEDLAVAIHPHPTLSESLMEAAEVAAGEAVHIAVRKPART